VYATRVALAATAQAVRLRQHPAGRWNAPSRFHITLQFLGGYPVVPDDIVARATKAAGEVATEPFSMRIDRASSFGSRVWWVGPADVPAPLSRLASRLRDGLRRHAVPHERGERFTPHVTILRDADRSLPATPMAPVTWTPDAFVLAVGTSPGTGEYRVLERWRIGPPPRAQAGLFDPV
jgi:2'-5' RNA ligase